MQIISYGGGIQTTALAILNAQGRTPTRASVAVFADPGSEMPGTYEHVDLMRGWLVKHGIELVTVKNESDGPLEQYIRERSTVIPVYTRNADGGEGLGRRQCTDKWKRIPVERAMRELGAETQQIGISLDEFWRMKTGGGRIHPLIDMKLRRSDCRQIIADAGLPIPPKSACYFCPLKKRAQWQQLAVYHPQLFGRAVDLEHIIRARKETRQHGGAFLTDYRKPLEQMFSSSQLAMDLPEPANLCGGYCMV